MADQDTCQRRVVSFQEGYDTCRRFLGYPEIGMVGRVGCVNFADLDLGSSSDKVVYFGNLCEVVTFFSELKAFALAIKCDRIAVAA